MFILDHKLMDYRIPFFNLLTERGYAITVLCPGDSSEIKGKLFKTETTTVKQFSAVNYRLLPDLKYFDLVVCMQNIRMINLWLLSFNPGKNFKLVHWGIGTSSAVGLSLKRSPISWFRNFLARFSSAQVLYSDFPLPLFDRKVVSKTFIANNTVYNPLSCDLSSEHKDSFLFIGSLIQRKGLDLLFRSFSKFLRTGGDLRINKLVIIGDGPIKSDLIQLSQELKISSSVVFVGSVFNNGVKKAFFSKAVASISPLQSGLSVLESFSYGVPFICYSHAISGGEHLNIANSENGYLIGSIEELTERMLGLNNNSVLAVELGHNAYKYYVKKRQMRHMVDVFDSCFQHVLAK